MKKEGLKTIEFERKGLKFILRNFELNNYEKLIAEFKIEPIIINKENDGFFYGAEFDEKNKAIVFPRRIVYKDLKANGVILPNEAFEYIQNIYYEYLQELERKINEAVEKVIKGEIGIYFSVYSDYPIYQAYLKVNDKDFEFHEHEIVEKAIRNMINDSFANCFEYLTNIADISICRKDKISQEAFDLEFNESIQQYHNWANDVVTGFKMKLSDILKKRIEQLKKKQDYIERKFKEAKEKNQKVVLWKWTEECNDPRADCDLDVVIVYANPDGTTEEVRQHTY